MNMTKRILALTLVLVGAGLFAASAMAASADLRVTKTATPASAKAGDTVTYTIVATNLGPDTDPKVQVKDNFDVPNSFSSCSWTCSAGGGAVCKAPSGTGDFDHKDRPMPKNSTLTFTAACIVGVDATTSISNTAEVKASITDPVAGNNKSTVTTNVIPPTADLSITKTDGVTSAYAGDTVTYTIVATNLGPDTIPKAQVKDDFPATLTCAWTCAAGGGAVCKAASGTGDIDHKDRLMPAGSTLTYTAACTIAANATGSLTNIATITTAWGTDPVPANNTATDVDTLSQAVADLSITKTDGVTSVAQGGSVTYTIVAHNAGPDGVTNAHVTDTFPAGLTCSWTCSGANGGVCAAASGSGSINHSNLVLPMGGTLTYSTVCAVSPTASGPLVNTATISSAALDNTSGNNSASDSDSVTVVLPPSAGNIIFDMTANPTDQAISTNLLFYEGNKGVSAIDNGYGGNSINIDNFHVLFRDVYVNPNALKLVIGKTEETVQDDLFGCGEGEEVQEDCGGDLQNKQFAEGGHLFDIDRLRAIADWMATNNTAIQTNLPAGTYGTISYAQLISNIVNNRTMYGVVRVKVPLQACPGGKNCGGTLNALGQTVAANTLYGLCQTATALCACGPDPTEAVPNPLQNQLAGAKDIAAGATICSMNIPSNVAPPDNRKIKVKGAMLWDFVDSTTGNPIPLERLPWEPRKLYFKVIIPISVNGDHDADGDGAMDNMLYIQSLSANQAQGTLSPTIDYTKIPASTKADYLYYTGEELTQQKFGSLEKPTQYHLLMANGYPAGWVEAFTRLGISRSEWTSIPGVEPALRMPEGDETITESDIRNPLFEDIPAYLYTGGLIDMHDQVNISGLIYVPQGMELEAKNGSNASPQPTRQYVIGAIVVRDSFYIEAKVGETATVISSEPAIYSTAQISALAAESSNARDMVFGSSVASSTSNPQDDEDDGEDDNPPAVPGTCYTGCGPSSESSHQPGASRWIEVRPEPADQ